jgi:hypothetical protein
MNRINLYYRQTHSYVPGWKHLDSYAYLGYVLVKSPAHKLYEDDEEVKYRGVVQIPSEQRKKFRRVWRRLGRKVSFNDFVCNALEDYWTGGCQCEHDCCGCFFYSARANRVNHKKYTVIITGQRNI